MTHLLSIDPAVHSVWWARFENRELVYGGQFTFDGNYYLVSQFVAGQAMGRVVVEEPKVYRGPLAKGDPEDLLQLAKTVGACMSVNRPCNAIKPADWKGQLPKDVAWRRFRQKLNIREMGAYEAISRAYPKSKLHNLHDAIGIGLRYLGRLDF